MNKGRKNIVVYAFALVFVSGIFLLNNAFAQWTGPTSPPPLNNVAAPINVSDVNQRKEGGITLGADLFLERGARFFSIGGQDDFYISDIADTLVVESESRGNLFSIENNGNTNINGDLSVSGSLFVAGQELNSNGGGITDETDPTVPASLKDGVAWSEISDIPAGFSDGVDNESTVGLNSIGSGEIIDGSVSLNDINSADVQRRVSGVCAVGDYISSINQDGTVNCSTPLAGGIKGTYMKRVSTSPGGYTGEVYCGIGDLLVGTGCYDSINASSSGSSQCACASPLDGGRGCSGYFSNDGFIYCLDL